MQLHSDQFKSRYDAMDYLCRAFMCINGKGNAVMVIDQNFSTVHYFSCSSMGYVPQGGQRIRFTPENVEAAVYWLFFRADKRFDRVFRDYDIPDIREEKKELGRKQHNYFQEIENDMITIGGKDYIKQMTEVISNRDDAQSILAAFCDENDIQLPKKIAQQGMCPFCNQLFQKDNGKIPQSCPVCRKSFLLNCPKCGREVNYAEVRVCTCGFHTDHYPRLAKKCEEARVFISTLNFSFAESRIAEVQAIWNNYPLLDEITQELKKRREEAGAFITRLNECLKAHKFQSAHTVTAH